MKYIYFLILIICSLFLQQVNALTDIEAAKSIYEEIFGPSPDYDACGETNMLYSCDTDSNGVKFIYAIYFEVYTLPTNDPITIQTDFSPFTRVNNTVVIDPIRLGDSFYNNVNKMVSLKTLTIQTQTSTIGDSVVFPTSLGSIKISSMGTKVSSPFFNGKISLSIESAILGYSIVSSIPNCPSTKPTVNFEIPISNLGSLPSNLFDCWDIVTLTLNVLNKKQSSINPNSQSFQFPNIPPGPNEPLYIVINFEATSVEEAIMFTYPSTFGMLGPWDFTINNFGFQLDKQLGYFDLPYSDISLNNIGNTLFGECTKKPCIKASSPFVTLKTKNANYNINLIDFSSIGSFYCSYNLFQQPIPLDMNITRLSTFSLTYSSIYGDVPYYLYLVLSIDLSGNGMNGTVPSPFLCEDPNGMNYFYILDGNNFSNYNKSTIPSCPNFKIEPIGDNFVFDTTGGQLLIKGTDLGAIYSNVPDFTRYSPIKPIKNEQLLYPIPQGVGKNHKQSIYFQQEFGFSLNFTYSYIEPTIIAYRVFSGNEIDLLGIGFDYSNENPITVNGESVNGTFAYRNITRFNYKGVNGKTMDISINVGGSIASKTFTYFETPFFISAYVEEYKIYSSGGEFTLFLDKKSLSTISSDISNLSFYIGNKKQTILSKQSNGFRIKYDANTFYTQNIYDRPPLILIDHSSGLYDQTFYSIFLEGQWDPSMDNDINSSNLISINFNLLIILLLSITFIY